MVTSAFDQGHRYCLKKVCTEVAQKISELEGSEPWGKASIVLNVDTQIVYDGSCSCVLHSPGLTLSSNISVTCEGHSFPLCPVTSLFSFHHCYKVLK